MSGGSGKSIVGWTGGADRSRSFDWRCAIDVSTAMMSGDLPDAPGKTCSWNDLDSS